MTRSPSLRARFAVPFVVAGVIALGAALPSLSSAASPPKLPDISLRQLITKAESPTVGAFDGTITWTASLGLPNISELSSLGGSSSAGFDWTSLISGSHNVKVWSDGDGLRLALIGSSSEVDLYSSPSGTWEYDSVDNHATHFVLPAGATHEASPGSVAPTPENVGQTILSNLDTWTSATFATADTIANQPAYVVSLAPRPGSPGAQNTTLGHVTVAVDAANGAILRIAVYGVGATSPSLEFGFGSVNFLRAGAHLPASDFAFSPGPGVSVTSQTGKGGNSGHDAEPGSVGGVQTTGTGWSQVVVLKGAADHLQTAALPPKPRLGAPLNGHGPFGGHVRFVKRSDGSNALNAATTAVQGSWGTGRLLSTNLVSALILPNGDVIAGFVTVAALEAAAASVG